jgi:hypothetical protein
MPFVAAGQMFAGIMLLLAIPATRRAILHGFGTSRTRRRWHAAYRHCGIQPAKNVQVNRQGGLAVRGPGGQGHMRVMRIEHLWSGQRLHLRLSRGMSFDAIGAQSERLAAALRVSEVRVRRNERNASRGTVTLIRRDPLLEQAGKAWPAVARTEEFSLWEPILLGKDEHGEPVSLSLVEKNVLIGGAPGSGKSCAMSMLLAAAALSPDVRLHLIDGKEVELALWSNCADDFAVKIEDAILLLDRVRRLMDERYAELRRAGLRKVDRSYPLHVVAVDELALFTAGGDKKARDAFADSIRDLVARGRAAGVITIAATQKPSTDVVPSSLRDLFAYKWALHCATPQASDTILGQGWASQGADASKIGRGDPGVGYLLAEDGLPSRLRTFYLDDNDVRTLSARAQEGRR